MNFETFQRNHGDKINVSRETFERLEIYATEIRRWNPKINLVAKNSLDHLWERHFLDSLQILPLIPPKLTNWVDLGSGGGFPGLILAASIENEPGFKMCLIESDQRKCAFLRTAARAMGVTVDVISERIEDAKPQSAHVISARALAPLDKLLAWAAPHAHQETIYIFPKGKNWQNELTLAQENWQMVVENHQSLTDPDAQILILTEVKANAIA